MIWFNVHEAYSFLTKYGEVFTLRPNEKREGKCMLLSSIKGKPHYKGIVEVSFCRKINLSNVVHKAMLLNYVYKSGFKTIEEWLSKAKESKVLYLYYVKLIRLEKK